MLICATTLTFAQKQNIKTIKFKVLGDCGQCKTRIESTLKKAGVYKAIWNEETNLLIASFDSTKLNKSIIQKKLADVGHESEGFTVTDSVYNKLPECCQYERTKIEKKLVADSTKTQQHQHNIFLPKSDTTTAVPLKKDSITKTEKLGEIFIESKRFSTFTANTVVTNTLTLTAKELTKAACCNLSESFETSPSIDVSYSDAVTGMKQIQLLGLNGNYTQLTTENVSEIKGLPGAFGLTFIPGPFVESIQVTKGTGSVVNGYESIAGQINIEEKKADAKEKLFFNSYANNLGRLESSLTVAQKLSDKFSTALLLHANANNTKQDKNKDGFLDMPVGNQINLINRWKFENLKGLETQFIIKYLQDKRQAGQTEFNEATDKLSNKKYGLGFNVNQFLITSKIGYVFPKAKYQSIGLILSGNQYNNNAYYGLNAYVAKQNSFYANLIFQSIIGSTIHKYRVGLSYTNENYNETFSVDNFKRKEIALGTFAEYTYTPTEQLTVVAGLRLDKHNEYGFISTPRLNVKYAATKNTTLRFTLGSGFKTANIFAENIGYFASSRVYKILNPSLNYGYGLQPEKAWNFGINILQKFKFNNHQGSLSVDAYHTKFVQQTIADVDASAQKILFYNLTGKSYSNSIQTEINYELLPRFDIRLAYKWLNVKSQYQTQVLQKPLTAKDRAFINLAYTTKNKWSFDFTTQYIGSKRLPATIGNPAEKQMENYSPAYFQLAAQISKQFGKRLDVYIGGENITNAMQSNLIIDAQNPFSKYFDASLVWGNVNGSIYYAGIRYKINKSE